MGAAASWTKWRDKPVIPKNYDDIAALVKLARRARDRIVEFDWAFSGADLRQLREAVHHWGGSGVVGRFKCFDSRVLAAINQALGEHDTVFVLGEPKNMKGLDCEVSCDRVEGTYRLRGHGPFDVVFGYGCADASDVRLGKAAGKTMAAAVRELGWDADRLAEKRLRPVRNALCGLALNYGISEEPPPAGPATEVAVHFHGPFSAVDAEGRRCLFADPIAERSGVYLWTINVGGQERPWYIGQTARGFGERIGEHIAGFLSGQYDTMDASALSRGQKKVIWRADSAKRPWPQAFLREHERIAPHIVETLRQIRFFVAPLEGDEHLLGRVEGTLGHYLQKHESPEVREFFGADIHLPSRIPYDKPLVLVLTSESPIAGLPPTLPA